MDSPATSRASMENVIGLLGQDFVYYILNISAGTPIDEVALSAGQEEVVSFLSSQVGQGSIDPHTTLNAVMNASNLSGFFEPANTSVMNYLRGSLGGVIEVQVATGDPFTDAMVGIASDIWPMFLMRPNVEGPRTFWMSTPAGSYNHPRLEEAVDAFLADASLRKFFPFEPEPRPGAPADSTWFKASRSSMVVSNGHGGSLQLVSLISGLIANAAFRCLIADERLSLETVAHHLNGAISELRKLAMEETVYVPALVGFAGLSLPSGSALDLPEGRVRPATKTDQELFMSQADSLATVFETKFPQKIYAILEHKFEEGEDPFKGFSKFAPRTAEAQRSFTRQVDFVRLSLVLASSDDEPWLAREVARYIPDLLSHGGASSWDPGPSTVPASSVPESAFPAISEMHATVRAKHVASLDIGMRRLLSAATMRTDPIDAFVDAVICWESLFGVRTETTFRVTGSIAKLLEPDRRDTREELHKELKDLYAKRSALVHGGAEPDPRDVERLRRRAVSVARDCLRALYLQRPDLLELTTDARGARILLE